MSKGSGRRPEAMPDAYADGWARIFGAKAEASPQLEVNEHDRQIADDCREVPESHGR